MLLDTIKRWSLSAVGLGAIFLIFGYSFISSDDLITTLTYTSSPILLSFMITVAGFEIGRRHDEDFVASVALWAIVSGTLGVAINQWYVFLGGALPSRPFYFTVSSISVTVAFGTATGYFYTALQRNAEELERTNELLRDRNRRLDEFASVVSHDLRNPLNIAAGYLDLARDAEDEDEIRERLDKIDKAHDRMDRLINEVLSFTRMGDKAYEPEELQIEEVVEEAVENTQITEDNLELKTDAEIHADKEGVQRLFENLLRNSVEHGSTGSKAASDASVENEDDGVKVEVGSSEDCVFYVEDNGPGIPEEEREKVLEGGYTTKDGGTGFGLPIVRRTAEAHGWSVEVGEGDEGGARFEFVEESDADD